MNKNLARLLPALDWTTGYDRGILANDLLAAVIVTIMLIPQSLAYALLAGLPAEMGLYASILPLAAYALFGSSRTTCCSRCPALFVAQRVVEGLRRTGAHVSSAVPDYKPASTRHASTQPSTQVGTGAEGVFVAYRY